MHFTIQCFLLLAMITLRQHENQGAETFQHFCSCLEIAISLVSVLGVVRAAFRCRLIDAHSVEAS